MKTIIENKKEKCFENLLNFMQNSRSVIEWNNNREKAKEIFDVSLIRQLDGSGFIRSLHIK